MSGIWRCWRSEDLIQVCDLQLLEGKGAEEFVVVMQGISSAGVFTQVAETAMRR